jgi:hypothetical protein
MVSSSAVRACAPWDFAVYLPASACLGLQADAVLAAAGRLSRPCWRRHLFTSMDVIHIKIEINAFKALDFSRIFH